MLYAIGTNILAINHELHKQFPNWYPAPGTVGEVIGWDLTNTLLMIQWEIGSTSDDDIWFATKDEVEGIF